MGKLLAIDPDALPLQWGEVVRHPAFFVAGRNLAANMLALSDADDRLSAVFKDAGRYVAAMSAIYLHGAGGLTLPLLRQICSLSGIMSPGRARAILEFLQHLDYLRPAEGGRFLPTGRFLLAWRRHLQAALDAAIPFDPSLGALSESLADPDIFAAFLAIQAKRLHLLTQEVDPFPALRRAFLHPYAGSQILWILALGAPDGALGTVDEIRLSLSDLSSRFDVTHLHVRRLLRNAEEEGILTYQGHGRVTFTAAGLMLTQYHFAFQLSEIIESGHEMLASLPTIEAPPSRNIVLIP